jgi:hypothetical protein
VTFIVGGLRPIMPDSASDEYKKLAENAVLPIQESVQRMEEKFIRSLFERQRRINLIIGIPFITMMMTPYISRSILISLVKRLELY